MTSSVLRTATEAFRLATADIQTTHSASLDHALSALLDWSLAQGHILEPLPAGDQATVAFGLRGRERVVWRVYPRTADGAKLVLLPGLRGELRPDTRAALVAALEAAVPGLALREDGHLQCGLEPMADTLVFARVSVVLAAALAVARSFDR